MSEVVRLRTRAEIDEEAATWIWRMESGSAEASEGFDAWLRQDPRHRRAVEELTKVWNALDSLTESQRLQGVSLTDSTPPRRRWWLAAAAALIAAAGGIAWLHRGSETQTLATAVGQHRNVVLSDGTVVALNTNTIVETNFSRHAREIYLTKGEAHFEVARSRSRPFLVHAGDALIRAIGTGFEVRLCADRHVEVLVNEGRVQVEADSSNRPAGTAVAPVVPVSVVTVRALNAGQQLSTATRSYDVIPVTPDQLSSELAWREGAVVFDNEPLSQAIAEIQRYTDTRILVSDPSIGALPVGGRFKTNDLQGFLDGLEAALPVTIRRAHDGLIYVDARR
jgi:transmembrane sensor